MFNFDYYDCQRRRVRQNCGCTRRRVDYYVNVNQRREIETCQRTGDAVSLNAYGVTVASGAMVPIMQTVATQGTTIDVAGTTATVRQGAYLITFGGNAESGDVDLALFANGITLVDEVATQSAGDLTSASRTILYNATATTTFALNNNSDGETVFANVGLTIVRLS